jgi:hypothetical protein
MSLRTYLIDRAFLPRPFSSEKPLTHNACDFLLVEGFGRNTFANRKLPKLVRLVRDRSRSDQEAFEVLSMKGFDPGKPNRLLAKMCVEQMDTLHLPAIIQWEVAYALWENEHGSRWYRQHVGALTTVWPPEKGYPGTKGLYRQAKETASSQQRHVPLLIAHPEHVQRCYFLAKNLFVLVSTAQGNPSPAWFVNIAAKGFTPLGKGLG